MKHCGTCGRPVYRNWDKALRDYGTTYRHPSREFSTCAKLVPVASKI